MHLPERALPWRPPPRPRPPVARSGGRRSAAGASRRRHVAVVGGSSRNDRLCLAAVGTLEVAVLKDGTGTSASRERIALRVDRNGEVDDGRASRQRADAQAPGQPLRRQNEEPGDRGEISAALRTPSSPPRAAAPWNARSAIRIETVKPMPAIARAGHRGPADRRAQAAAAERRSTSQLRADVPIACRHVAEHDPERHRRARTPSRGSRVR